QKDKTRHTLVNIRLRGTFGASFDPDFPTGIVRRLVIEKSLPESDLVLLKFNDGITQSNMQYVSVCTGSDASPGQRIFKLGFSGAADLDLREGLVSGSTAPGGLRKISIPIVPGDSGAPIISGDQYLVGIAKGGLASDPNGNYMVPINLAGDLLSVG